MALLPLFYSCAGGRYAINFDHLKDSITQIQYSNPEVVIQKNDILNITVSSLSAEASQVFNMPNAVSNASLSTLGGYLVADDGKIQFPILGSIKAEGLTKTQLRDTITRQLLDKKLLLEPIVSIRNLNYKVTVLGEVLRPSVINVPSEKISILEALGAAGDLTIFSNRSNVLLIREENNKRIFKVMNLNSNEIFSSPYFYLKPNDVIYVEPNQNKIASVSPARQWLPIIFSAISLAIITSYRIR